MTAQTLAVDLGGTNMRAALVDPDGTVAFRTSRPTPHDVSCVAPLERLMSSVVDRAPDRLIADLVIGVPGRVDYTHGRLEYAPNLPTGWREDLNEDHLSNMFGKPVALANDADAAAVGEAWFGAGRDHHGVLYVTFSTGVGAGVVLGQRILRAGRSLAEVGHTVLAIDRAVTGRPATVENLASGTALVRADASQGTDRSGAMLVAAVERGEPTATRIFGDVAVAIGITVANLAHLFAPDVIVLGGGLGRNLELLAGPVRQALEHWGPRDLPQPIPVVSAALGDDAGLAGCAAWSRATGGEL